MANRGREYQKLLCWPRCGLLWCAVLGMTMGLTSPTGAQMQVKVDTVFSTQDGLSRLETDYRSTFSDDNLQALQQHQYFTDLYGKGGAVTVGAEFLTGGYSEIGSAGISIILKEPLKAEGGAMLYAVEKIGTAFDSPGDSFGAAAGSRIIVNETMHMTNASTLDGKLVYLLQSTGTGELSAGVAGEFNRECVECKECKTDGKPTLEDIILSGLQPGPGPDTISAGFQRVDLHIDFSGKYSGVFQVIIEP